MRSWRCGNFCISVDERGVGIENNVGGSTLTSEGYGCSLEEFLAGQMHDAIPADLLPEVIAEAARLAGRDLQGCLEDLERRRRKALTGYETDQEERRDRGEWIALVRTIVEGGPPELWDEELVRNAAALAGDPAHASWAQPFLERMVVSSKRSGILAACIDWLSGGRVEDAWVSVSKAAEPRFGKINEAAALPSWISERPSCSACGSDRTSLIFCRDCARSDQSYDYLDAAAEVHCASCGGFSVHVRHSESRC